MAAADASSTPALWPLGGLSRQVDYESPIELVWGWGGGGVLCLTPTLGKKKRGRQAITINSFCQSRQRGCEKEEEKEEEEGQRRGHSSIEEEEVDFIPSRTQTNKLLWDQ